MKLQELLEKATERPWEIEPSPWWAWQFARYFVLTKPSSPDGRLTKPDALLQRHAVNNFERMLDALRKAEALLASLDIIVSHESSYVARLILDARSGRSRAIQKAIRQAEEVKE